MIDDRFKTGYVNWRYNPFTDEDLSADIVEDNLYIPSSAPFLLQLKEVPRKDTPSTISVYCYDDGINYTEVTTSPASGEFRVDYPPPDGHGTGLLEFNSADAGKKIKVTYKGTGSPMIAEFLEGKISYPSGGPIDGYGVKLNADGTPYYAPLPLVYSAQGIVVYNANGEDESAFRLLFKTYASTKKVNLFLKGIKIPQWIYTELAKHNHAKGTLWVYSHTHSIAQHKHDAGDLIVLSVAAGDDGRPVLQQTALGGPTATGATAPDISGETADAGVDAKTYPDSLKVYLDGTNITSNILSLSGLSKLGNGTSTHAFVTTGTGEIDIASLISGAGIHELKITEPTANAGGGILIHVEVL